MNPRRARNRGFRQALAKPTDPVGPSSPTHPSQDVCTDERCLDTHVAKSLLNCSNIVSSLQHVSRETMLTRVWRRPLSDLRPHATVTERAANSVLIPEASERFPFADVWIPYPTGKLTSTLKIDLQGDFLIPDLWPIQSSPSGGWARNLQLGHSNRGRHHTATPSGSNATAGHVT